jgi:hypothetical protein
MILFIALCATINIFMSYIDYKDYPQLPQWLVDHLYKILETNTNQPIKYDDDFKERMIKEAEMLMGGADQATLDAIAFLDYNEEDTLGGPFTDPTAYDFFTETLARFDFIPVDQVVIDWVTENIPEKVIGVNLQVMYAGEIITPHIDELRHYALNYTLERGGDNVQTVFYKVKPEYSNQKAYPRTLIPFSKLDVIESEGIPEHAWHKMNISDEIHSVLNLDPTRKRIALSCSIIR